MSAIFGIINKDGKPIEQSTISAMQTAMQQLAVDGSAVYHSKQVMLGHQQLVTNIFQINERLPYEDDTYVITADACIDNRKELSNILSYTSQYPSLHDSLIILEAYKKWGSACTNHLEGEFAFAIWNKKTQTFFAATDHIGFRRFHYYDSPTQFIFATKIKSIQAVKKTPLVFNEDVLIECFTRHYSGITFDKEIFFLSAARYLLLEPGKPLLKKQYWQIKPLGKYKFNSDEDWVDCLRELLTQSIQNRLHTDHSVGVTLSGGLDSSFVTAITAGVLAKQNKPLYAFSAILPEGYNGPEKDEQAYIKAMGKRYDNIVQTYVCPPASIGPLNDLEAVFDQTEQIVNVFHYLDKAFCEAAHEKQVRILFNGFGGDMNISNPGKDVIYGLLMRGELKKALHYLQWKRNVKRTQWDEGSTPLTLAQLIKAEILTNTPLRTLQHQIKGFRGQDIPLADHLLRKAKAITPNHSRVYPYNRYFQQRINSGSLGFSINSFAVFSPFYQLEMHMPLLNKNINEFYFDLPPEQLVLHHQQRSLIRRAMKGYVPDEIINRTDKKPYSPDFHGRLIAQQAYLEQFLSYSNKGDSLNVKMLQQHMDIIANNDFSKIVSVLYLTRSGIINAFLKWANYI